MLAVADRFELLLCSSSACAALRAAKHRGGVVVTAMCDQCLQETLLLDSLHASCCQCSFGILFWQGRRGLCQLLSRVRWQLGCMLLQALRKDFALTKA